MSRKQILVELKTYLKTLAVAIQRGKSVRKPHLYATASDEIKADRQNLYYNRYEFRHLHIAYCELRGRSREQIENPSENNKPNTEYINQLKQIWMEKIDEAVRSNAA